MWWVKPPLVPPSRLENVKHGIGPSIQLSVFIEQFWTVHRVTPATKTRTMLVLTRWTCLVAATLLRRPTLILRKTTLQMVWQPLRTLILLVKIDILNLALHRWAHCWTHLRNIFRILVLLLMIVIWTTIVFFPLYSRGIAMVSPQCNYVGPVKLLF